MVPPLTIVIFGFWLIILAFMKKTLKTSTYGTPPLMVRGIFLIGRDAVALSKRIVLILVILILITGIIAILYSFMKRT